MYTKKAFIHSRINYLTYIKTSTIIAIGGEKEEKPKMRRDVFELNEWVMGFVMTPVEYPIITK